MLSLDATNRIYSTAGAATIKRHTVSHKGFHQFRAAVRLFEHELSGALTIHTGTPTCRG